MAILNVIPLPPLQHTWTRIISPQSPHTHTRTPPLPLAALKLYNHLTDSGNRTTGTRACTWPQGTGEIEGCEHLSKALRWRPSNLAAIWHLKWYFIVFGLWVHKTETNTISKLCYYKFITPTFCGTISAWHDQKIIVNHTRRISFRVTRGIVLLLYWRWRDQ